MPFDSVCVFCGSRDGRNTAYVAAARETGTAIARRGWRLVYGGGHVGLMGAVADAALAAGGEVIGIMPRSLLTKEIAHPGLTRLHLVTSMHRRKALMSSMSDGYLTMPGGFGTLEEFFETLTWAQLGLHTKPCALLNTAGYWDALLDLVNTSVIEGFVAEQHRHLIISGDNPDELLDRMTTYIPPTPLGALVDLPEGGPPVHRDLAPDVNGDGWIADGVPHADAAASLE